MLLIGDILVSCNQPDHIDYPKLQEFGKTKIYYAVQDSSLQLNKEVHFYSLSHHQGKDLFMSPRVSPWSIDRTLQSICTIVDT